MSVGRSVRNTELQEKLVSNTQLQSNDSLLAVFMPNELNIDCPNRPTGIVNMEKIKK